MPEIRTCSSSKAGPRRRRRIRIAGALPLALLASASFAAGADAAAVPLGTSSSAAVLAGSTATNTGPTVISGDLGVSPGTAVTGFPPGLVGAGTIHAADAVALQAKSDLTIAYVDAAARSSTSAISSDLAGRTLTSGVYTSASSMGLSGDLTLDGQGDSSSVFVFQAGSTLTAASASRVRFIGGAQACNVFWQVGSSASIGSTSAFAGNILALTSITLKTGATLYGSALARNGAVTMDTNTITRAACTTQSETPPSATDTSSSTGAGQPVTVVLDGAGTGGGLIYIITAGPANGTLGPINQSTGTVTYTPNSGYVGTDGFSYLVTSPNGSSGTAISTVHVTGRGPGATPTISLVSVPAATPRKTSTSTRLTGPPSCVGGPFMVRVIGSRIARVTFYVDGKRRQTLKGRAGRTVFGLRINAAGQNFRVHRVTAKVRFTAANATRSRTLRLVYQRCSRAATTVQFTG